MAPTVLKCGCVVDPIFQSDSYQLAQKLLDAAVLRQQAIATNIANIETPGFRRLDVSADFATQLKSSMAAGDLAQRAPGLRPQLAVDQTARSVRPDGNSVEIEHELLALNRNAVEHEFLSEVVSGSLKRLRMAISGRVT